MYLVLVIQNPPIESYLGILGQCKYLCRLPKLSCFGKWEFRQLRLCFDLEQATRPRALRVCCLNRAGCRAVSDRAHHAASAARPRAADSSVCVRHVPYRHARALPTICQAASDHRPRGAQLHAAPAPLPAAPAAGIVISCGLGCRSRGGSRQCSKQPLRGRPRGAHLRLVWSLPQLFRR